jgi:hypothetical protein
VVLCCAVARRKSASLRLVIMRSDAIWPQSQLRRGGNRIAVFYILVLHPVAYLSNMTTNNIPISNCVRATDPSYSKIVLQKQK